MENEEEVDLSNYFDDCNDDADETEPAAAQGQWQGQQQIVQVEQPQGLVASIDLDAEFQEEDDNIRFFVPEPITAAVQATDDSKRVPIKPPPSIGKEISCDEIHNILLKDEYYSLNARLSSLQRAKYELLRLQEESYRFHTLQQQTEAIEANSLAQVLESSIDEELQSLRSSSNSNTNRRASLTALFTSHLLSVFNNNNKFSYNNSVTTTTAITTAKPSVLSLAIEQLMNKYQLEYKQHFQQNSQINFYFPWQHFETEVQKSIAFMLNPNSNSNSNNNNSSNSNSNTNCIDWVSCEIYLTGYIECICHLPIDIITLQGKQCYQSAGSALGRHPFGSLFTKIRLAFYQILNRIQEIIQLNKNEIHLINILIALVNSKLNEFASYLAINWIESWSSYVNISIEIQNQLAILMQNMFYNLFLLCFPILQYYHQIISDNNQLIARQQQQQFELESLSLSSSTSSTIKRNYLLSTKTESERILLGTTIKTTIESDSQSQFELFVSEFNDIYNRALAITSQYSNSNSNSNSNGNSNSNSNSNSSSSAVSNDLSLKAQLRVKAFDGKLMKHSSNRAFCWRILLNLLPESITSSSCWTAALQEQIRLYSQLLSVHLSATLESSSQANSNSNSNSNSNVNNGNETGQIRDSEGEGDINLLFADKGLAHEIRIDLNRLYIDGISNEYLQSTSTQSKLYNVLFVWSSEHQLNNMSYRQGMHELAAVICYIVDEEYASCMQSQSFSQVVTSSSTVFLQELNDLYNNNSNISTNNTSSTDTIIEAFVYYIFDAIMRELQTCYLPNIIPICTDIQNRMLRELDPIIADKLNEIDSKSGEQMIQPQLYGMRWLRLLFCREFRMNELEGFRLWDFIFAYYDNNSNSNSSTSDISDSIGEEQQQQKQKDCVSRQNNTSILRAIADVTLGMIIRIRSRLLEGDSLNCLMLLMRYPPCEQQTDFDELLRLIDLIRRMIDYAMNRSDPQLIQGLLRLEFIT